jgi:hypothetical protein
VETPIDDALTVGFGVSSRKTLQDVSTSALFCEIDDGGGATDPVSNVSEELVAPVSSCMCT